MANLFTNPIETGNTIASINIVRKELTKLLRIINIVVQIAVLPYYIYLIYKNWGNVFYIVVYILLFVVSLAAFILELILNDKYNKNEEEQGKRKLAKGKRINSLIAKGIKYIVRILILSIAIFQIALNQDAVTAVYVVTTALSAIVIVGQIVIDIFIALSLRYFEFIRLGVEADLRESPILNMGKSEQVMARKLEAEAEALGVDEKASSERKKLAMIKEEMAKNKAESKRKAEEQIKHRSRLIRKHKFADIVSTEKMQSKMRYLFEKKIEEANRILANPKKRKATIEKAKKGLAKIPDGLDGLKELPNLLDSLDTLSTFLAAKVVAAALYFLDPWTAIHDIKGEIGFADDEYIAEQVIAEIDANNE